MEALVLADSEALVEALIEALVLADSLALVEALIDADVLADSLRTCRCTHRRTGACRFTGAS